MKKIKWSCEPNSGKWAVVRAEIGGLAISMAVSPEEIKHRWWFKEVISRMTLEVQYKFNKYDPVEVLRQAVESNKRYVAQTGRASEAVVLHPDHAAALLELLK